MELYNVFFVNRGHSLMITLNVNNTTVAKLNQIISKEVSVKTSEQILLCPRGTALDPNKPLSAYEKIGTKHVPLFLYQKTNQDREDYPNNSDVNYVFSMIDDSIEQAKYVLSQKDQHKIYLELPERATDCHKVATTAMHTCARLVQEHQFLYQGWMALIYNLDDSVSRLQKRTGKFQNLLKKMEAMSEKSEKLLSNFDDVLDQLKKIEVPAEVLAKPSSPHLSQVSTTTEVPPLKLSLYEWIARADPNSSLEEIADLVEDQIKKFKDQPTRNVFTAINTVVEQSTNVEYRDIKGINKRFSQLEHSLAQCEDSNKRIIDVVKRIGETVKDLDPAKLTKTVKVNRQYFTEIMDFFDKLKSTAKVFDTSKQELLQNVRTRLTGFIVQSYDKLNFAHMEMLTYEEKSNGIRLRLDLIEQIKDAPTLYSQTVSEVVRRLMFKSELTTWHNEHSEKCASLSFEESEMRKRIAKKLEKHFLRSLFPGMFDQVPGFFVKAPLAPYDEDLPIVEKDYISMLRQSIPELEQYLKVKLPEISTKLLHKDARMHPPPLGLTKREDSFITKEPMNIAVSQYNFSPANWLSEDGGDPSPAPPTILMSRSTETMHESQIGAVPIVPSLKQLDILSITPTASSSVAKSAPIAIPSSPSDRVVAREVQRSISDDSCKLDNQNIDSCDPVSEQKFESDEEFEEEDANEDDDDGFEHLGPLRNEISIVSEALRNIKPQIKMCSNKLGNECRPMQQFLLETLPSQMKKVKEIHCSDVQQYINKIDNLKSQIEESEKKVKECEQSLEENREKLKLMEENAISFDDKIRLLKEEVKHVEAETFKRLTIEYELMNDRTRSDYEDQLETKDQEIESLKREIEKKNIEIQKQQNFDPFSEDYKKNLASEIRAEVEKEFKSRIELITKAVEQKKDEGFARARKESEVEIKILSRENESKARKLRLLGEERDKLRMIVESGVSDGTQILQELDDSLDEIVCDIPKEPISRLSFTRSPLTSATSMPDMDESVFAVGPMMASTAMLPSPQSDAALDAPKISEVDGKVTMCTQTKICLPVMNMMVAIQDVKPGSTVLVIWDERHNAYILFCSSQYRHFVKESSVRKLGLILTESNATRRNWILGCATKIDNCAIKKSVNRYNLPIGTVVRRVEVDPVHMDIETDEQSIPGIAFRNAALADMRY